MKRKEKLDARGLPPHVKTDRRGYVKCSICGCTEDRACDPPCSWAEPGLCSSCFEARAAMRRVVSDWMEGAYKPSIVALLNSVRVPGKRATSHG